MEKFKYLKTKEINKLPKTFGVYAFKKGAKFFYVGKAANIKERVKQHKDLLGLAKEIGYIKTNSEIEALILEAKLIKKYSPNITFSGETTKTIFTWQSPKKIFLE